MSGEPYDPLDARRLAESVARALLAEGVGPLPAAESFSGTGIYAIYYTGGFEPYRLLAERNREDRYEVPIYVGKAIPGGRRKGGGGFEVPQIPALYGRLREHAATITLATNLDVQDFRCRYLVVSPVWIPLGEEMLIRWFAPLWNVLVDGFGNHDPGKGRYNQARSLWDVLHPGRGWSEKLQPNPRSAKEIGRMAKAHLEKAPTA